MFNSIDEAKGELIRSVARLCARCRRDRAEIRRPALFADKPLFIETVFIDDRETLLRLAGWMKQRGRERRQAIWLRDAALAERLDGVLFIGLKDWYPPIYDCGACGYATCAEFVEATRQRRADSEVLEFKGPQCNLRDIDLGIAIGSAAKAASLIASIRAARRALRAAARKLGLIQAEIAVALSMTVTHRTPAFDARMPAVDFDASAPAPAASTVNTCRSRSPDGRWVHRPDIQTEE